MPPPPSAMTELSEASPASVEAIVAAVTSGAQHAHSGHDNGTNVVELNNDQNNNHPSHNDLSNHESDAVAISREVLSMYTVSRDDDDDDDDAYRHEYDNVVLTVPSMAGSSYDDSSGALGTDGVHSQGMSGSAISPGLDAQSSIVTGVGSMGAPIGSVFGVQPPSIGPLHKNLTSFSVMNKTARRKNATPRSQRRKRYSEDTSQMAKKLALDSPTSLLSGVSKKELYEKAFMIKTINYWRELFADFPLGTTFNWDIPQTSAMAAKILDLLTKPRSEKTDGRAMLYQGMVLEAMCDRYDDYVAVAEKLQRPNVFIKDERGYVVERKRPGMSKNQIPRLVLSWYEVLGLVMFTVVCGGRTSQQVMRVGETTHVSPHTIRTGLNEWTFSIEDMVDCSMAARVTEANGDPDAARDSIARRVGRVGQMNHETEIKLKSEKQDEAEDPEEISESMTEVIAEEPEEMETREANEEAAVEKTERKPGDESSKDNSGDAEEKEGTEGKLESKDKLNDSRQGLGTVITEFETELLQLISNDDFLLCRNGFRRIQNYIDGQPNSIPYSTPAINAFELKHGLINGDFAQFVKGVPIDRIRLPTPPGAGKRKRRSTPVKDEVDKDKDKSKRGRKKKRIEQETGDDANGDAGGDEHASDNMTADTSAEASADVRPRAKRSAREKGKEKGKGIDSDKAQTSRSRGESERERRARARADEVTPVKINLAEEPLADRTVAKPVSVDQVKKPNGRKRRMEIINYW